MTTTSPIFLGTAQKADRFHLGWDLERVSSFVFVPYFPVHVPSLVLVLVIPRSLSTGGQKFRLKLSSVRQAREVASIDFETQTGDDLTQDVVIKELQAPPQALLPVKPQTQTLTQTIAQASASHTLFLVPVPSFEVLEPSQISVDFEMDGNKEQIGAFSIGFLKTPDLDQNEVKEIRRSGRDLATIDVACKQCGDKLSIYKTLSTTGAKPKSVHASISVEDISAEFVCKCGVSNFPTIYLKMGMHELFRHTHKDQVLKLSACYKQTSIISILAKLKKLIDSTPPEEIVQKFFVENPFLWNFLGPLYIIPKPRLCTQYTADFAIVNVAKILYFIELEKPQTKLVKQAGGQTAELQAGKDQIDTWRAWIADNRQAVLSELKIPAEYVHEIKYILVAGMESTTPQDDLKAVRQGIREDTQFFTFDQIMKFGQQMDRLSRDL